MRHPVVGDFEDGFEYRLLVPRLAIFDVDFPHMVHLSFALLETEGSQFHNHLIDHFTYLVRTFLIDELIKSSHACPRFLSFRLVERFDLDRRFLGGGFSLVFNDKRTYQSSNDMSSSLAPNLSIATMSSAMSSLSSYSSSSR